MKKAVIDLGFGDSGKGMFIAYLCSISNNPIVIRFSGGHQAGHTVVHNGIRHIFSSFGSGTLQGVPTYWDKKCTFYPTAFLNELHILKKQGIKPKIFVNGKCPVTTFCDVNYNKEIEKKNKHGSCGVGFGATLEREEKHYSLLVEDLQFPSILQTKLNQILNYYDTHYMNFILNNYDDYLSFLTDCADVLNEIEIVDNSFNNIWNHRTVIYEGSQGLMLDKDIGFFPHVTRANVGSANIEVDEIYYITRAYQTRHGNGPMTNESIGHNIKENPKETNVLNYQGVFRRTLLDLDLLEYTIMKDNSKAKSKSLVITCLDHVVNESRFTYKNQIISSLSESEFIKKIGDILKFEKIYISKSDEYKNILVYNS